jgi:hypothetical protein
MYCIFWSFWGGGIAYARIRIDRFPSQEVEKASDEEAVKAITSADYYVNEQPKLDSDPLGLSIGDSVHAETAE